MRIEFKKNLTRRLKLLLGTELNSSDAVCSPVGSPNFDRIFPVVDGDESCLRSDAGQLEGGPLLGFRVEASNAIGVHQVDPNHSVLVYNR